MTEEDVKEIADKIADRLDADLLLLNGELERPLDNKIIKMCRNRKKRKNLLLVLVTPGGDADVAYRVARFLQNNYENFYTYVTGWCKSAGTLLAIGAHNIIIGDFGELGPLDVQISKKDELFDYSSGLDISSALFTLEQSAFKMFEDYMLGIKRSSGNSITFKTASEVSGSLVAGLLSNIYSQIDPMKIGETARHMSIARDYGDRLAQKSGNLKSTESLELLVSSYSSHGFVIDFDEASELFNNVEKPDGDFCELHDALGREALYPTDGSKIVRFLNSEQVADEKLSEDHHGDEENVPAVTPDVGGKANPAGEGHTRPDSKGTVGTSENSTSAEITPLKRSTERRKSSE